MKSIDNFTIRAETIVHCYSTPALSQKDRIAQELLCAYEEGVNDQNATANQSLKESALNVGGLLQCHDRAVNLKHVFGAV